MSTLPFIYLDGSSQLEGQNKKIVRAHVAKYFHPHRQVRRGMQGEGPNSIRNQQPQRRIAPHTRCATGSGIPFADQHHIREKETIERGPVPQTVTTLTTLQPTKPPSAVVPDVIKSGIEYEITGADDQLLQLEERETEIQIEPAAVVGLLKSGASREKNLRIGWIRTGMFLFSSYNGRKLNFNLALVSWLTSTIARDSIIVQNCVPSLTKPTATNGGSTKLQRQYLTSEARSIGNTILPCPELSGIKLRPPSGVSVSPQAHRVVEKCKFYSIEKDFPLPKILIRIISDASIVDTGARLRGFSPATLPLRHDYMRAARYHDALWYASVSFASAMDQLFQGMPLNTASLQYKGQAMRAINTNLQNPWCQITDETIAAVQAVASIEVSSKTL
jgi:hypothetical protein